MASYSELYNLAQRVGLSSDHAKTAAAIALAESGGAAVHTLDADDDSWGYWQINVKGASNRKAHLTDQGLTDPSQLLDATTNAKVMAKISHGGADFSAWSTYTSGKYQKFLNGSGVDVAGAAAGLTGTGLIANVATGTAAAWDTVSTPLDAAKQALQLAQEAGEWIAKPENWIRIGYVVGGGTLAIVAIVAVIKSSEPGKQAIKTGKQAVKTAKKVAETAAVAAA